MFSCLPNETTVQFIHYEPEYSTTCTVSHIPFSGTIKIEYRPGSRLLEFESFETWLWTLAGKEFTIESYCQFIFDNLTDQLGSVPLRVTVNAKTIVHSPAYAVIERNK